MVKVQKREPVPVPLEVLEVEGTVGFDEVLQTTPLAVIGEPPSAVMFPPLVAVEEEPTLANVANSRALKDADLAVGRLAGRIDALSVFLVVPEAGLADLA